MKIILRGFVVDFQQCQIKPGIKNLHTEIKTDNDIFVQKDLNSLLSCVNARGFVTVNWFTKCSFYQYSKLVRTALGA